MRTRRAIWILGAIAIIVLASCQLDVGTTDVGTLGWGEAVRGLVLPSGATLTSAVLTVLVHDTSQAVLPMVMTVHRVDAPWQENTVTWNSFHPGGADNFSLVPAGSAEITGLGPIQVDVTSVVADWLSGAHPNYGFLLQDTTATSFVPLKSSQDYWYLGPFLTVSYLSPDAGPVTVVLRDEGGAAGTPTAAGSVPDAYIWSHPDYLDVNNGYATVLYVGAVFGYQKQSLVAFDLVQELPPSGSTRTIGYWKNHAGFGPQTDVVTPLLPVILGSGGGNSFIVVDAAQAVSILKMKSSGGPSNGIVKLAAQLLAAKLNIKSGASGSVVAQTIADADAFLAAHAASEWKSLSAAERSQVLTWAGWLDAYNNGIIGPGHAES